MASGPRFLSRRALLKLAAATPASALLISSRGEQAIASNADKATTSTGDKNKLIKVARHLYKQFLVGVHHWEDHVGEGAKITVEPEVFDKGFELSGEVVAANLVCFPDDPENAKHEDIPTRRCAVACGWWAAHLAHTHKGNVLDADIFERAWCDTREAFGTKRCDAATEPLPPSHDCDPGPNVGNQLPMDFRPVPGMLAQGCG